MTPEQWAEQNEKAAAWEAEQERNKRDERFARSGIPERFKVLRDGNEGVIRWAADPSIGLLLQGEPGRGKTHNACIALTIAIEGGTTARFVTFDDIIRECKAAFSNYDTEAAIIGKYANVGMLCIDDMGKERVTEWSLPIVFSIINKRSMNRKPTIVTTQYTGKQLVERMTVNGDSETARAIVSRFFEYDRIRIEGRDWRRK